MVTIIFGRGPVRFPVSRISVVDILHILAYEKPSLVKVLPDLSDAMPRQQKYQNPQAAREKEKQRDGRSQREESGSVSAEEQFFKLKWMLPNDRGKKWPNSLNLSQMSPFKHTLQNQIILLLRCPFLAPRKSWRGVCQGYEPFRYEWTPFKGDIRCPFSTSWYDSLGLHEMSAKYFG